MTKLLSLIDDRTATALRAILADTPGVRDALSLDYLSLLQQAGATVPTETPSRPAGRHPTSRAGGRPASANPAR